MAGLLTFVLTYIGAVVVWLLKGMKGHLESEMSRRFEKDFKYFRNLFIGLFVFSIFLLFVGFAVN